ncbi:hypothetical protein ATCR1_19601 [Agrobacterium tumefaciens CCNWGS0286]|nr:hypothetical protein ATCR1_19601 [Agrobacterium tumefaciens CCNWGS0286]
MQVDRPSALGGLEYVHGIWHDGQFRAFWAHDHAVEARALEDLLTFFSTRLEEYAKRNVGRLSRCGW